MNKINLDEIIANNYPQFYLMSSWKQKLSKNLFSKILHLREVNLILERFGDSRGIDFIDNLFEYLNFSFTLSNKDLKKIPSEGRLICIANHPIGSLDGLALLKLISEVRHDVKIVANDILYEIENLRDLFLPFNLENKVVQKNNIKEIDNALQNEEVVIIFPAAEVSRLKYYHIVDGKWHKGAVHFARKNSSPILPIFVSAKNSILFYAASSLNKYFSRFLLIHELFNKKNQTISLKIGNPIPSSVFTTKVLKTSATTVLLKKHLLRIGKNKKGIFLTEKNIIHPVDRKFIKKELANSKLLSSTNDGKKIFLCEYHNAKNVLDEIARLREITFRKVGEGTGNKLDIDRFDRIYKHIVVWDENELEIVGSYRLGLGSEIMKEKGAKGFYTSTLFTYSEKFEKEILPYSLELGRSFIQKKYWRTNALHYLWQGIGAFLYKYPEITYMFGGVSISKNYTQDALEPIVFYYQKWFGENSGIVEAGKELRLNENKIKELTNEFNGSNPQEDYSILKNIIKPFGFSVPTLYKQYTELCETDGVKFLSFGIDESFEMCVDGFILIEVDKIKAEKKARYINIHAEKEEVVAV